jgi:hypothetical protein
VIVTALDVDRDELAARTGWVVKPEGACKADVCVPLPDSAQRADGRLDIRVMADRLGMPLVRHDDSDLWSVGPETTVTGHALTSVEAPDLRLPDAAGRTFALSSLRGQKVVMVAWASW